MFATPASGIQAACINCGTTTTPLWRKADDGNNLCNACGLFLKLHGRPRPIALKTDVVKSRNRVKISPMSSLKRKTPYDLPSPPPNSRHADTLSHTAGNASLAFQTSNKGISTSDVTDDPTASAEYFQDVFDPQLTHLEQGENGKDDQKTIAEYDSIISGLRGRVNELELINDLYRGRIVELERKNDIAPETDLEAMLLDETKIRHRISELQKHLEVVQGRDLDKVVDM